MAFPGDARTVRRVVAAIVDVFGDGIVDVLDQPALDGQAADCRDEALGDAVDGIVRVYVAELGCDVSVPDDDAVGGGALFRERAEDGPKGTYLIAVEIPGAAVGEGVFDSGLELFGVQPELLGSSALPLPGGGNVALLRVDNRRQR